MDCATPASTPDRATLSPSCTWCACAMMPWRGQFARYLRSECAAGAACGRCAGAPRPADRLQAAGSGIYLRPSAPTGARGGALESSASASPRRGGASVRARRSPEGRATAGASKGPHGAGSPSARHLRTERGRGMTRRETGRRAPHAAVPYRSPRARSNAAGSGLPDSATRSLTAAGRRLAPENGAPARSRPVGRAS